MKKKERNWFPYIKLNNSMYNGFWGKTGTESFEAGYVKVKGTEPVEKIVLSRECDSIFTDIESNNNNVVMDVLRGGYIRFWHVIFPDRLYWLDGANASTCFLCEGEPHIDRVLTISGIKKEKIKWTN